MKKLIAFVAFAFALGSVSAFAADAPKDNMKSDKPAAAAKKKASTKDKKAASKQSMKKDEAKKAGASK